MCALLQRAKPPAEPSPARAFRVVHFRIEVAKARNLSFAVSKPGECWKLYFLPHCPF